VVALPLAGFLYEGVAAARDARRFPPPGTLVDVGGRRLHLLCIGSGRPIVIVEPSGFGNSESSSIARLELATRTRVCSYDRMGQGWSDPGPWTVSAGMLADDLRRLQERAALEPPFIIVASSIGGLTAEMFTRRFPERVAGLVLADAANSAMIPIAYEKLNSWLAAPACLAAGAAGRVGLVRLLDPFDFHGSSSDQAARSAALTYGARPWATLCAIVRGMRTTQEEFARAPALARDVPLVVLVADGTAGLLPLGVRFLNVDAIAPPLRTAQAAQAHGSTRGVLRTVPGSGHLIASDKPAAVVDAVNELLVHQRSG